MHKDTLRSRSNKEFVNTQKNNKIEIIYIIIMKYILHV